jgi:hypothetical protein
VSFRHLIFQTEVVDERLPNRNVAPIMIRRPPSGMARSSIENSGPLTTRTLQRHKHPVRDFFPRHKRFHPLRNGGGWREKARRGGCADYILAAFFFSSAA